MRLPQQYIQPMFRKGQHVVGRNDEVLGDLPESLSDLDEGARIPGPDGEPLGDLPEGHPLIGVTVHCEECGATLTEAGSRISNGPWFETGWFTPTHDDKDFEQQNYCSMHYGGHVGIWGTMVSHFLLPDGN